MAKKKQKKKKRIVTEEKKVPFWEKLTQTQKHMIVIGFILATILIYFYPIIFQNKVPPSSDIIAWKGNVHSIQEAKEQHDYVPLWANNVFSGMPSYLISILPPFEQPARYIIDLLEKIINRRAVYFLIGGIGMLLMMQFLGTSLFTGLVAGLGFIWWPHLIGLFEAGHNSKVHTIMLMPLIIYSFMLLLKKTNLLSFSLFAIAFSLGIRAGHYQIMFYTGLALIFYGIVYFVQWIKQKEWKSIAVKLVLAGLAVILAMGMSAFHSMLVREYSKYSIRGGTGEKESKGLSFDYATNWSLQPAETLTFVIPRFYGGVSAETYQGNDVPQLRGRTIPGYWGHLPFTTTTDYLGIVIIVLAATAVLFRFKNRWVLTTTILILFAMLMAFGRYFPVLYKLFFNYFPFFNKFRAPGMIVVLVHLGTVILAGLGLEFIISKFRTTTPDPLILRRILILLGVLVFIGFIPTLFKSSLAFTRPQEISQYQPEVLEMLKKARYDMAQSDASRLVIFAFMTVGLIVAFLKKWMSKTLFLTGVLFLLLFDLFSIDKRFMQNLVNENQMDRQFKKRPVTGFLQQDATIYRVFPLGELFDEAYWPYWHQSIGGYHPAKLRIYQDVIESCLYKGSAAGFHNSPQIPINWNIVNMLNAKYILAKGRIEHNNLSLAYTDQNNGIFVYANQAAMPRVFSVDSVEIIPDRQARFERLNNPAFDPAQIAILEANLSAEIAQPSDWQAAITRYEPNYIDISVSTDVQTLLALSEIYYPAGWKAFIDGQQTEILKTNHILRSVIVPAGNHKVEFKLEPQTYTTSIWIMGTSILVVYLALGTALGLYYRRRKSN